MGLREVLDNVMEHVTTPASAQGSHTHAAAWAVGSVDSLGGLQGGLVCRREKIGQFCLPCSLLFPASSCPWFTSQGSGRVFRNGDPTPPSHGVASSCSESGGQPGLCEHQLRTRKKSRQSGESKKVHTLC